MLADHISHSHPFCPPGSHTNLVDGIILITEGRMGSEEGIEQMASLGMSPDKDINYDQVMQHALEKLLADVTNDYMNDESKDQSPYALMHLAGLVGFAFGRAWQEIDTALLAQDRQLKLPNYKETEPGEKSEDLDMTAFGD